MCVASWNGCCVAAIGAIHAADAIRSIDFINSLRSIGSICCVYFAGISSYCSGGFAINSDRCGADFAG